MYYVFFIYAFINGHSDYFHILAKINNAAVNLGIQIFLQDSDFISFISMPRSGIINHQMVLFLISWGFLSCLHQFTSHQGASFLRIFPRVPLLAFKPSRYEMISDCIFKNNTFLFKRLFFFFLMWTIFKVLVEFVTISLPFYVLVFWPRGTWDLNSLSRDRTGTPCIRKAES